MLHHLQAVAAHAYYTGHLDAGRDACERILRMPGLPDSIDKLTRSNRTWYSQRLDELIPSARFRKLDEDFFGERVELRPGWSAFNPSVLASQWRGTADGFLVALRSSNYRIEKGQYIICPDDAGRIRTVTYLLHLSDDLDLIDAFELPIAYPANGFEVEGLEDLRLNLVGDTLLGSGTVRDLGRPGGVCRVACVEINRGTRSCRTVQVLDSEPRDRHEKNWMPLLGRRAWLRSCHDRGHVCLASQQRGTLDVAVAADSPPVASQFRGGSQAVPIGDGQWLAVVHEVAEGGDWRVYEHRVVCFSEPGNWAITKISPPFCFREPRAIEFAAGLAIRGLRLVASFGVRDAEAWLVEMPLPEVLAILEPV